MISVQSNFSTSKNTFGKTFSYDLVSKTEKLLSNEEEASHLLNLSNMDMKLTDTDFITRTLRSNGGDVLVSKLRTVANYAHMNLYSADGKNRLLFIRNTDMAPENAQVYDSLAQKFHNMDIMG
jgi:hypothetical protein